MLSKFQMSVSLKKWTLILSKVNRFPLKISHPLKISDVSFPQNLDRFPFKISHPLKISDVTFPQKLDRFPLKISHPLKISDVTFPQKVDRFPLKISHPLRPWRGVEKLSLMVITNEDFN
jgi:hypothetical protein